MHGVDLTKVSALLNEEEDQFVKLHPKSRELYNKGLECYLYGAPIHWMQQWPGKYPIYIAEAKGAHLTDVDGLKYTDFALGDTGSMFGHGHVEIAEAIYHQAQKDGEAHNGRHAMLEAYIHLYLLNRGVLLTHFHNMVLMYPFTTASDVEKHNQLLDACLSSII